MVLTHATINCLLKQAWRKQLNGREICLESDGTLVDEDAILQMCAEQPLMILAQSEKWTPFRPQNPTKKDDKSESSLPYFNLDTQTSSQQEDGGNRGKDRFMNCQEKSSSSFSQPTTLSPSSCAFFSDKYNENSYISKTIGNKFENFSFPWNKFPNQVLELCHKNMKLGSHVKSVVHVLVDELRAISCHIPIPVFRSVTATLIAKFPKSFSYTDAAGNPLPVTNSPLITSMIHRNNYLNRPTTSKSKGFSPLRQRKRQKTTKSLQDPTMNWEISSDIKVDDEDHLIRTKEKLIALSSNITYTKEQNEIIKELMQQLYETQRNFLNSFKESPSVKDVRNEWPFLLQKIFVQEHFLNLTQIDTNEILNNFEENINKILKYATEKKDKLLLEARKNHSNDNIVVFNFICKYFGEDIENIFQSFPIGIALEEIRPKGNFPWIALIETESDKIFYIFVDSEIANCQCRSFPEAFIVTFCLFFNFNRDYPTEISLSYEFFQRYLFGINLEKPRGHKRNLSSIAKVIRLINSIRE